MSHPKGHISWFFESVGIPFDKSSVKTNQLLIDPSNHLVQFWYLEFMEFASNYNSVISRKFCFIGNFLNLAGITKSPRFSPYMSILIPWKSYKQILTSISQLSIEITFLP